MIQKSLNHTEQFSADTRAISFQATLSCYEDDCLSFLQLFRGEKLVITAREG
jgi:hypothetical protein